MLGRAVFCVDHLKAGLLQSDQMPGEVSAVHRRDVGRLEYAQIVKVVPVVEMSPIPAHSLERAENPLESFDRSFEIDEFQIVRYHHRETLEPDVGR